MHLTMSTDYSFRVLIYLGSRAEGYKASIPEISTTYGISQNHLNKVVHKLGLLGYLKTTRGHGGGISLALPVTQIGLGRLVRQTEESFGLVECMRTGNQCIITPACKLKPILHEAKQAFLRVLDSYTLADIIQDQDSYQRLFQIL